MRLAKNKCRDMTKEKEYYPMNSLQTMWGGLRYEFRMQVRRPLLWLVFFGFTLLDLSAIVSDLQNPLFRSISMHMSLLQFAGTVTSLTNWLPPLGVGILLADRLVRDRRMHVEELLTTLPGTLRMRLLGKYLGVTCASLVPAFLLFLVMIGVTAWATGNVLLIPASLLCYAAIVLPGILFISAFSLACPVVIWLPLYQFLFFGYWVWGNLFNTNGVIPTLNGTILTPIGSVIAASFFSTETPGGAPPSPVMNGVASLVALLGIAVLVLVALDQFLKWEQARQ
jgi:ABC-2 type transport system permease protein